MGEPYHYRNNYHCHQWNNNQNQPNNCMFLAFLIYFLSYNTLQWEPWILEPVWNDPICFSYSNFRVRFPAPNNLDSTINLPKISSGNFRIQISPWKLRNPNFSKSSILIFGVFNKFSLYKIRLYFICGDRDKILLTRNNLWWSPLEPIFLDLREI